MLLPSLFIAFLFIQSNHSTTFFLIIRPPAHFNLTDLILASSLSQEVSKKDIIRLLSFLSISPFFRHRKQFHYFPHIIVVDIFHFLPFFYFSCTPRLLRAPLGCGDGVTRQMDKKE